MTRASRALRRGRRPVGHAVCRFKNSVIRKKYWVLRRVSGLIFEGPVGPDHHQALLSPGPHWENQLERVYRFRAARDALRLRHGRLSRDV